jgi:predicted ATPase/DNA-binding SARP family transcriptional activator/transposase-like protein
MATGDNKWRVSLFGGVRAERDTVVVDSFQTQKTAVLLALLAVRPGRQLLREELIDSLWPDADIEAGRNRLNQALAWLRGRLEPSPSERGTVLLSDRKAIALSSQFVSSDVQLFEIELDRAHRAQDDGARLKYLLSAASLFCGEFLPGQYDQWIMEQRTWLSEARINTLLKVAEIYARQNDFNNAAAFARRAVDLDPLHEESHEQLIRILIDSGQPNAALRQYNTFAETLKRELGSQPSPSTTLLVQRFVGSAPLPAPPKEIRHFTTAPLPQPITRFFGRAKEITRICEALERRTRLISLLGIGGSGKTRLAIEAANRVNSSRKGEVSFVPLADISTASAAPSVIAEKLGMRLSSESSALVQIIDHLSEHRHVLILDNAEHLLPELALLVHSLLSSLPELSILVTSQRRLEIEGEHVIHVSPLEIPFADQAQSEAIESESVQLFLDRIHTIRPSFNLTEENIEVVTALCRGLEGMPLAIELCAAWARTLTPKQMLKKLLNRFDLLVSSRVDIAERHRSLRAAIEYSIFQLNPEMQEFFAELSIFRGGWTLSAIEAIHSKLHHGIHANILDMLSELLGRSLIEADDCGHEMRYRMLESLRLFGQEQLIKDATAKLNLAHAEYFVDLTDTANKMFDGPSQQEWAKNLDLESQNIAAALQWCLDSGSIETGMKIASRITGYWKMRGRLEEAKYWLSTLLSAEEAQIAESHSVSQSALADTLTAFGFIEWSMGNFVRAAAPHKRALEIRQSLNDSAGISESLYHLGINDYRQDLFDEATKSLKTSLAISEATGNLKGVARALLNLGNIAMTNLRQMEARPFYERALQIEQELGDIRRVADSFSNIGLTYGSDGDLLTATKYFTQSIAIRREINDDYGLSSDLFCLGKTVYYLKDINSFQKLVNEGLLLAFKTQNKYILAQFFLMMSMYHLDQAEYLKATYFICCYTRIRIDMGVTAESPTAVEYREISEQIFKSSAKEHFPAIESYVQSLTFRKLKDECLTILSDPDAISSIDIFRTLPQPPQASTITSQALCPHCGKAVLVRFGHSGSGKQRFRCNTCQKVTNEDYRLRQSNSERRQEIITAFKKKTLSQREVSRIYHVSRNTLSRWIKQETPSSPPSP